MQHFKITLLIIAYVVLVFLQGCQPKTKPAPDNNTIEHNSTHENPDPDHEYPVLKKPAIYLYPKQMQQIQVSLKINGSLLTSIPEYANGWSVTVAPDGMIDGQYDYLFYENSLHTLELPDEGWIKGYSELDDWLGTILPKLGINTKETR